MSNFAVRIRRVITTRRVFALFLFMVLPGTPVAPADSLAPDLRDYVAIVEPVYHEALRNGFEEWASYFSKRGDPYWERFFRWHAGDFGARGYGSGWAYVSPQGKSYLIQRPDAKIRDLPFRPCTFSRRSKGRNP